IPGLDDLVNGGYFLGSTTVAVGISGAGKSMMGLQYLAEGVRRGETGLMLSLDEQVDQIKRNAAGVGLEAEFTSGIDKDLLRVEYEPPQEIEVDVHFHHIEELVEKYRPRRVVIDSLSTYASNLGSEGRVFRDFFHGMVALMKEYQVAAVYNHENPEMLGMASMMGGFPLSSLVDNILLLNWIELSNRFRLGITVAKMRANPVDRTTREYELTSHGMRVMPQQLRGRRRSPFS